MRPLQAAPPGSRRPVHHNRPAGAGARGALSAAIALYRAMDMVFWLPQAEAALAQVAWETIRRTPLKEEVETLGERACRVPASQ